MFRVQKPPRSKSLLYSTMAPEGQARRGSVPLLPAKNISPQDLFRDPPPQYYDATTEPPSSPNTRHKCAQKRRRDDMNRALDDLQAAIQPHLQERQNHNHHQQRVHKVQVVEGAVVYIRQLQRRLLMVSNELEAERMANNMCQPKQ